MPEKFPAFAVFFRPNWNRGNAGSRRKVMKLPAGRAWITTALLGANPD